MSAPVGFGEVGCVGEDAVLQRDGADVEIVSVDEKISELYLAVSHEDGFLEDGKTADCECGTAFDERQERLHEIEHLGVKTDFRSRPQRHIPVVNEQDDAAIEMLGKEDGQEGRELLHRHDVGRIREVAPRKAALQESFVIVEQTRAVEKVGVCSGKGCDEVDEGSLSVGKCGAGDGF